MLNDGSLFLIHYTILCVVNILNYIDNIQKSLPKWINKSLKPIELQWEQPSGNVVWLESTMRIGIVLDTPPTMILRKNRHLSLD